MEALEAVPLSLASTWVAAASRASSEEAIAQAIEDYEGFRGEVDLGVAAEGLVKEPGLSWIISFPYRAGCNRQNRQ